MTTRAVLYLRISEDRTGEGLGVARQRADCEGLCTHRGWQVTEVITENDVSASSAKPRPGFVRLLAMVDAGEIDAIVVYHADRLVRRLVDLETIIDKCEASNVKLVTVSGDLDLSTDTGRLNARILTSVARAEIERKSERQRRQYKQAAEDGKPTGGRRAFGYTADGLHLEPTEALVAAKMFKRFAAGDSLGEIKRLLIAEGVKTPRGYEWTTGSVKQVLANPRYAGLRGVRQVRLDERGRKNTTASGYLRRERWFTVTGAAIWPAVVDESTWQACVQRLRDPQRAIHYTGSTRRYLLSGLAVCGICDRKLKSGTQKFGRTLKCPSHRHVNRLAERIERYVVDVICERLRQPDAIDLVQVRSKGIDLRDLREEAEALRERLTAYTEDAALGRLTSEEFYRLRDVAHKRLSDIDEQIAATGRVDVVAQFACTGHDPAEMWSDESCTLSTKRAVIDALAVVRVMPGTSGRPRGGCFDTTSVQFKWRIGK